MFNSYTANIYDLISYSSARGKSKFTNNQVQFAILNIQKHVEARKDLIVANCQNDEE